MIMRHRIEGLYGAFHTRIACLCVWMLTVIITAMPAHAQERSVDETAALVPPSFTVNSLDTRKQDIEANAELSEDDKTRAIEFFDRAITALNDANAQIETGRRYQRSLDESADTLSALQAALSEKREQGQSGNQSEDGSDPAPMTEQTLMITQQALIAKEAELRRLSADVARDEAEIQSLINRPTAAGEALSTAEEQRFRLEEQLNDTILGDPGPLVQARRSSLEARIYFRSAEIFALEQDLASLPTRLQIATERRDLTELDRRRVETEVIALQRRTGQRRLTEAQITHAQNVSHLSGLETQHPLVVSYAAENIALSQELIRLAETAGAYPAREALTRRQLSVIDAGRATADELVDLGNLNRQSSETLRRIRRQTLATDAVERDLRQTRATVNAAIQNRLLLENRLRNYPIGALDIGATVSDWKRRHPDDPGLQASDHDVLQHLHTQRRNLLSELTGAATHLATNATNLQTLQTELFQNTQSLTIILDQELLWLPSVEPVSPDWPVQIMRGFNSLIFDGHVSEAWRVLVSDPQTKIPVTLLIIVIIGLVLFFRQSLWEDIEERSSKIGRVQHDSYWHSPVVTLASIIRASVIPLGFLLLAYIYSLHDSLDPVVAEMDRLFLTLALFTGFFLIWRDWDLDKGLFDAHFKLHADIRHAVNRQLRWFVPSMGLVLVVLVLSDNAEPNIYEAMSVFAFIIGVCLISVFAHNVLWREYDDFASVMHEDSFIRRHIKAVFAALIILPILSACMAASGYFDTAKELIYRLFISGQLLILTYVLYRLVRRTVQIAQRRLSLRQAIERREKAQQARKDKEDAEERGETSATSPTPVAIDYERIDVETMSRQTSELLLTFMVIGFAVLMWAVWRDLLPALGIFDDIKLGGYEDVSITLWDAMQSIIFLLFTIIAAKNLPGFLEIFVLNRTHLDSGTKYAIKTVLGYIIIVLGLVFTFDQLGIQWSQLQWIVAALSLGVGFGLQEIIANFISGLIILFERPVRVGDYVTISDQSGTVSRIQIRATTLADLDNREILIPNKELITGRVTNWTLSNSVTRLIVPVGIAYGSDTDRARDLMLQALKANPKVLDAPAPQVLFLGFGDSSLDFELRVFLRSFEDRWPVSHTIHTAVNKALEAAGITIPFPQFDMHIVSGEIKTTSQKP